MPQLLKLIRSSMFLLWLLICNIHCVQMWQGSSEFMRLALIHLTCILFKVPWL